MKPSKEIAVLAAGIILIAASFAVEGPGLVEHATGHVYEDLTADLAIHLFLLGMLLAFYSLLKASKKAYIRKPKD